MARPEKNNVDYFPFICKEGKSMYYIEHKYKNDGFATWIKILRQLAVTDYHYLNLANKADMMFLSSKCLVTEEMLISIIDDLCAMGEFDPGLWKDYRVVFSQKFVENIQDAYIKRSNDCVTLDSLLTLLLGLGVIKPNENGVNVVNNPHIIEYHIISDNKILDNTTENDVSIWPSFEDFWIKYDKKTGKSVTEKKWGRLKQSEKEAIMTHLEQYIPATPDPQYRKNPQTYLNQKAWNDEIIKPTSNGKANITREQRNQYIQAKYGTAGAK
jgi:hypothetical protein